MLTAFTGNAAYCFSNGLHMTLLGSGAAPSAYQVSQVQPRVRIAASSPPPCSGLNPGAEGQKVRRLGRYVLPKGIPVRHSRKTIPHENRSARGDGSRPRHCSGAP